MTGPAVSVIVPVLNGAGYLRDSIGSAVAQTMLPTEIIIVDDGSSDGSSALAESIETPFAKRLLRQNNRGQSAARNLAASVATGTYLAFLDHDDI